jgi:hypothetical protein
MLKSNWSGGLPADEIIDLAVKSIGDALCIFDVKSTLFSFTTADCDLRQTGFLRKFDLCHLLLLSHFPELEHPFFTSVYAL